MVFGLNIAESREDRFRRSALLKSDVLHQGHFEVKIADKLSEWINAFRLLYEEYLNAGYIGEQTPSRILFDIHHILPETMVFIASYSDSPIATLTQFFDNILFGLPSDVIYKAELDKLRSEGRFISELGSLATQKKFRWKNLFHHLCRAMYWYSRFRKVNDLCIAVNPKHVPYYKTIFLFEAVGPIKFHPRVRAPAVLMRLNLDHCRKNMMAAYQHMQTECNLHDYFHNLEGIEITDYIIALKKKGIINGGGIPRMDSNTLNSLLNSKPGIVKGLTSTHIAYLKSVYPTLFQ